MKKYGVLFVVVGAMGSLLIADALRIDASFQRADPCPDNFTGMLPNPSDCHSFYICDDGRPGLIQCPAGLCFNPSGQDGGACDHCEFVPGCGSVTGAPSSTSQAPSTTESQPPSTTTTQSPPETSSPSPDPTTAPTTASPSSTPSSSSTTTERTTTPNGEDLQCPPDVPYIYLPYPGDCNKFYYCQNGVNTGVYNCGVGLWFQFRQQVCTVPWGETCDQ